MNKIRILQLGEKRFKGEVILNNIVEIQTVVFPNKANCLRALNNKIRDYNLIRDSAIPLLNKDSEEFLFEIGDNGAIIAIKNAPKEEITQEEPAKTAQPTAKESKPKKPKRKPFTPYGLNGYLVDKNGNVRLMLDRRASANTIVLEPEMFSALAEMVKKTQTQSTL